MQLDPVKALDPSEDANLMVSPNFNASNMNAVSSHKEPKPLQEELKEEEIPPSVLEAQNNSDIIEIQPVQ